MAGEIVCAGNHATDELVTAWAERFARFHPSVHFQLRHDTRLTSTAFKAAVTEDAADLTPCAREPFGYDLARFRQKYGEAPLVVAVATGSYATKSATHALAIYVHADNPLSRLTIEQLHDIYARDGSIVRWGQLGLPAPWADQPIHVYGLVPGSPNGRQMGIVNYVQLRFLHGGESEFKTDLRLIDDAGPEPENHLLHVIVRAVAADRYGIGYSGFANRAPGAKTLLLADSPDGPFYAGTHDEVARRVYPLTRAIYMCVNQPVTRPLKPAVREYLRFILSREGQQVIADLPEKYLPLTAGFAAIERAKVD
ncbi:MAG: substrate-binding domain-containing protein [Opitutaceae bacterium]|nr:substrate-binding domain-containing protein [Opitutaceae bacterium]